MCLPAFAVREPIGHKYCYGIHANLPTVSRRVEPKTILNWYSSNIRPQALDTTISDFQSHQSIICTTSTHSKKNNMDASATHAPADKSTLIYVREFHHRGDSVVLPGRMVNTFKVSIVLSCGLQWKWSHRNSQHYYIGSTRGTQLSVTFISTSRYRLPWCYLRCNLGRRDSSRSCRNREGRPFRSLYSQSLIDSSGLT